MTIPSTVVSVHQQIASQLRANIRRGVYLPGDPLREGQLATQFGVSRSPVRQVLQELTREGLLHSRPNCGTVVADPPSPEVMRVLRECRTKLECIALRQCFFQLNEDDFDRCHQLISEMYTACEREDYATAYELDTQFHRVVVDKATPSGSTGVYSVIAGATAEHLTIAANRPFHEDFRELYAIHASLLAMYRLGDLEIACEALSQHILRGPFVEASCRCWRESGKSLEIAGIYDPLADDLRKEIG